MLLSQGLVLALVGITATEVISASIKKKGEVFLVFFAISAVFSWILLFFYYAYDPNTMLIFGNYSITAEGIENMSFILTVAFQVLGFLAFLKSVLG